MNTIAEKMAPQTRHLLSGPDAAHVAENEGPLLLGAITISLAPS